MSEDGEITRNGLFYDVRFERRYARPIERVFAAVTVPERLAAWLAHVTYEPRVGGALRMVFDDPPYQMDGVVTAWSPPRLFAFTWPDQKSAETSVVRFELTPEGDGCRLVLTNTFVARDDVPGVGGGWHEHLCRLAVAVDGVSTTRWDREREAALAATYRAKLSALAKIEAAP